ncbi:MAG TPA: RimK family protein [Nitrosospira sp.]|nr:RimK family protein [Nitrosospira sp.]
MKILIVVDGPADRSIGWFGAIHDIPPPHAPDIKVLAAHDYLADPVRAAGDFHVPGFRIKVLNLCASYRYLSPGYYVSLLAEARGHRPLPKVGAVEDLQSPNLVRHLTEDLGELIQRLLAPLAQNEFELNTCFGHCIHSRYAPLGRQLFGLLQIPLLCARFERHKDLWSLRSVRPIAAGAMDPGLRKTLMPAIIGYSSGKAAPAKKHASPRFDLAILHAPQNPEPPSNEPAMQKFRHAAEELGIRVEFIARGDIGRLPEFDALFIRDTTYVNHYTYRFSRRALAHGLVVIDEPDSILKCNNKVYLSELLAQHRISAPKTLLTHAGNIGRIVPELGLPCILKQPDSSFSRGVVKIETEPQLHGVATELLAHSALIIAQEWVPSEFDWRVGIIDRKVLFVARYGFPPGHWQIIKRDEQHRKVSEGVTQAVRVDEAPPEVVGLALKAANLIGDGFYGVDIKQAGSRCLIIEINDNPNVDHGNEDAVLQDALYHEVMGVFLKRIEARKLGKRVT